MLTFEYNFSDSNSFMMDNPYFTFFQKSTICLESINCVKYLAEKQCVASILSLLQLPISAKIPSIQMTGFS